MTNNTTTNEYTCEYCGCVLTEDEVLETSGHIHCEECGEHLFICDCCGEVTDDRTYCAYDTEDGSVICEECAYNYYTQCHDCGTYVRNGDIIDAVGRYGNEVQICEYCSQNDYYECTECGRIIHCNIAYYDEYDEEYYCEDCQTSCGIIHEYGFKPDPVFYGHDDTLYMGVELEIDHGEDRHCCARDLNHHGEIYLKSDSSLDNGFEIVSHPCTLEYHKGLWGDITEIALSNGFESHDARTCGLHVHMNRDYFGVSDTAQNYNIGKLILLMNKHWDNMVKFSRRTMNQLESWANRVELEAEQNETPQTMELKVKDKEGNRYVAVNLCNTYTVELRLFNGSLRKETVLATLEMCRNMAKAAKDWTLPQVEESTFGDIVRIAETEYLEDYCARRGINLEDKGISVVKKCWNAIKDHGASAGRFDIVHISPDSGFAYSETRFNGKYESYLRVIRRTSDGKITVCQESCFKEHGMMAFYFNILPEWIDMVIKEDAAQRLRTLELIAATV